MYSLRTGKNLDPGNLGSLVPVSPKSTLLNVSIHPLRGADSVSQCHLTILTFTNLSDRNI